MCGSSGSQRADGDTASGTEESPPRSGFPGAGWIVPAGAGPRGSRSRWIPGGQVSNQGAHCPSTMAAFSAPGRGFRPALVTVKSLPWGAAGICRSSRGTETSVWDEPGGTLQVKRLIARMTPYAHLSPVLLLIALLRRFQQPLRLQWDTRHAARLTTPRQLLDRKPVPTGDNPATFGWQQPTTWYVSLSVNGNRQRAALRQTSARRLAASAAQEDLSVGVHLRGGETALRQAALRPHASPADLD